MPTDVLEIYINSRTATQIYNNLISDSMYSLPVIEINKNEKAYICVKNAVIPNSFYNVNNTNNKLNVFDYLHKTNKTHSILGLVYCI